MQRVTPVSDIMYPVIAWAMMVLVIGGFGPLFYFRAVELAPLDPRLYFHGVVFTLWFLLFAVQIHLARYVLRRLHAFLGYSSFILVILMVYTGMDVAAYAWDRQFGPDFFSRTGFQFLPFSDLVFFVFLYGIGILNRQRTTYHQRYMMFASLSLLVPATSRFIAFLGGPGAAGPVIPIMLGLVILGGEWLNQRRFNRASLAGFSLMAFKFIITIPIAKSETWSRLVIQFYGA